MCDLNTLQQKIADLTNNGEVVIQFLADTVQGKTPHVQPCHRLEATRQLIRLGTLDNHSDAVRPEPVEGHTADRHSHSSSRHSRASGNPDAQASETSPTMSDNPVRPEPVEGHTEPRPIKITYLDILNFNLAQLIRSETAEGHTIVEFLLHIMTGRDIAYTENKFKIKPADRMAASREILRRGYGHFGRRRKLIDDAEETNDYDTLHSDLARRMRQYSEEGSQAILFLLGVMKNDHPTEEYTAHQRMSAAQELLRRGWDTNYDKIKMEHLMDYWQDKQSARLSVGQKKHLAGLQAFVDEYDIYDDKDYEAIAKELREQQDREAIAREAEAHEATSTRHSNSSSRHSRGSGNPEAQNDGDNPSSATGHTTAGASGHTPTSPDAPKTQDTNPVTADPDQKNTYDYTESDPDPDQDCYYEPLSPEDQALFDYHTLIESGEYEEGEIQPRAVTETDRLGYQAMLKWIHESAQAEGVPVLPNPLSGSLKRPKARSP